MLSLIVLLTDAVWLLFICVLCCPWLRLCLGRRCSASASLRTSLRMSLGKRILRVLRLRVGPRGSCIRDIACDSSPNWWTRRWSGRGRDLPCDWSPSSRRKKWNGCLAQTPPLNRRLTGVSTRTSCCRRRSALIHGSRFERRRFNQNLCPAVFALLTQTGSGTDVSTHQLCLDRGFALCTEKCVSTGGSTIN